jgi:hypothetical protein
VSAFTDDVRRAFAFLERDFGARLHDERDGGGAALVAYRSQSAFVHVGRDWREHDLMLDVGPLEGGAPGRSIPFDAVLEARGADVPGPDDLDGWATALRAHGTPLLDGDFAGMEDVDAVLRRREEAFAAALEDVRAQPRRPRGLLRRLWDRLP